MRAEILFTGEFSANRFLWLVPGFPSLGDLGAALTLSSTEHLSSQYHCGGDRQLKDPKVWLRLWKLSNLELRTLNKSLTRCWASFLGHPLCFLSALVLPR